MSSSFRKPDHVSFRKPGANRIEDGVLVIPKRQTWNGFFSFRSDTGAIIRGVPIDSAEWTAGQLYQIGTAVGINARYRWFDRPPDIVERVQARIRFEEAPAAAPPPETEEERRARTARLAAKEAQLNSIREEIAKITQELADIQDAIVIAKPSVVAIIDHRAESLRVSLAFHTTTLARLTA